MFNKGISLVIPVYNEAEIIKETINIFTTTLYSIVKDFEIIIVDDGSTDCTAEILRSLSASDSHIKALFNKKNIGSGASLWRGFREARNDLVISNFADKPFDLNELTRIIPLFDVEDVDFVVVVRKDRSANTFYRKITSYFNFLLIRHLFGIKISDFQFVQCYKKKVLDSIDITSHHTFAVPETIIKALSLGFQYKEYQARFYPRIKGEAKYSNPLFIFRSVMEIFKFYWKWRILRYIKI